MSRASANSVVVSFVMTTIGHGQPLTWVAVMHPCWPAALTYTRPMASALGDFLRTRRAKLSPDRLDFAPGAKRRVPGLRREEVAMAAGLSVDYYRRLEQGRETRPSEPVLTALAQTLELNETERQYMYSVAGVAYRLDDDTSTRPTPQPLLDFIDSVGDAGAIVLDPVLDIIATNEEAQQLFAGFTSTANLLEMVFLDPEGRKLFVDWEASAAATVANLRASANFNRTPARLAELLSTLTQASETFAELWARHDVEVKTHETKVLHHPARGLRSFEFHAFSVASLPGYLMLIYRDQGPALP